ncbi:hypothetical protein L1049_026287 [Liquidambar formosana]|uniref:Uncharacterized protein n=1 Tax=Liquidambar formosana TaxID=63359 RepID=A0AAP0R763_LIQFO
MGSFEEDELLKMVRDFIESSESPSPTSSNTLSLAHQSTYLMTLQEILRRVIESEAEVVEKVKMHLRNMGSAGEPPNLNKCMVARLKMDGFEASLCKSSWVTTFGRPAVFQFTGDYEYIDVMMKDGEDGKPTRLIVDMDFRSQFELARPTPTYRDLTNTLPSIFVGTEGKLNQIISLLCSAAKQSLKQSGLHIPPWRKASYMQSKWLSEDCKKVSVLPNREVSIDKDEDEAKSTNSGGCSSTNINKWAPPAVKPRGRVVGGGSALSSQFSKMGINCC